jgi:hypothetical protein
MLCHNHLQQLSRRELSSLKLPRILMRMKMKMKMKITLEMMMLKM